MPLNKQTLWGREPGGSEVGSLDVWMFGCLEFESWKFGCLEKYVGMFGGSEVGSLVVWMFGVRKLEVWMFAYVPGQSVGLRVLFVRAPFGL